MKKILAFVLASLMVLSLVPASAFAAFTKCPAVHTTTNCVYDIVSTQLADCQNIGYQVLACVACGEQFVANYVQKLDHTWVSDKDLASQNIKASCIYETNGIEYLVCAVEDCNAKYNTIVNGEKVLGKIVKWNSTEVHDVKYVSGVGCSKVYECSICKKQGYLVVDEDGDTILGDVPGHNYTFTKMEVEPKWENGTGTNGKAIFTCTDIVDDNGNVTFDGCGVTKTVDVINPSCNKHDSKYWDSFKVVQAAVAPNCTTDGYYLVVKCPDCGKLYYDQDADNDPKTKNYVALSDLNDDDATNKEDAKISNLGHSTAPAGVNCQGTYVCNKCDATVTGSHAYGDWTVVSTKNCLVQGYKYRVCSVSGCGKIDTKTEKAQGHSTAKQFISATCATQGAYYEYCKRDNCPLTKTKITDPLTKDEYERAFTGVVTYLGFDTAGHDTYTQSAGNITANDLFCTQAGYVITYCRNNCSTYAGGVISFTEAKQHVKYIAKQGHNYINASSNAFAAFTTRTYYACAECDWTSDKVDVVDTTTKNTFASEGEALVYHGFATAFYEYDEDDTQVIDHYESRKSGVEYDDLVDEYFIEQKSMSTSSTCTTAGKKAYFCKDCGTYLYITLPKAKHTEGTMTEGYAPTCTKPGMQTTYKCTECGVTFWKSGSSQKTSSAVINCCSATLIKNDDGTVKKFTDCSASGTGYYECAVCGTYYTKTDCATKYVKVGHKYKVLLAGKAATCNAAGLPEVRYCTVCKQLEVNTVYEVAGEEVRINHNTTGVKYGTKVVVALGEDQHLSKDVVVTVGTKGELSYEYLTITQYVWPSEATVIKMEAIAKNVGNVNEHWAPYVDGKLASGVVSAANVTWKKSVTVDESYKTENTADHTQPTFKIYSCEACEYEYLDNFKAATYGHVNDAGYILTEECENEGPTDRFCVVCETDILVAHTWSEFKGAENATCVSAGAEYRYCLECGHYEFKKDEDGNVIEIALPDADKFHASLKAGTNEYYEAEVVGTELTYASNKAGYLCCPVCKVSLTEYSEEKMTANGLEIFLTTDATEYIPGSKVYVTVTLDSLNGVNVWALNFPVKYDAEIFDYVGYAFNTANSAFQTFAVNELAGEYIEANVHTAINTLAGGPVTDGTYEESGIINIVANADSDVYVKGAQELMVLEFVVTSAAAANDIKPFAVKAVEGPATTMLGKKLKDVADEFANDNTFGNYYQLIVTGESKTYGIDVRNANGKKLDYVIKQNVNYCNEISITAFLELDGEDDITLGDAYVLYSLIYNNEYDVKADADFDGSVTAKDLSILYAILTGAITVEQIVTPDAELPEGFDAWMGAK